MGLEKVHLGRIGRPCDREPSKSPREEAGRKLHRGSLRGDEVLFAKEIGVHP